jgi:hypothetical protein
MAGTMPTAEKKCSLAAQAFVKIADEKLFGMVATSDHAAQFTTAKKFLHRKFSAQGNDLRMQMSVRSR